MGRLEHAITRLQEMQSLRDDAGRTVGPVCGIVVTLCYLVAMLSVPVDRLGMLLWFAVYPIVASPYLGRSFTKVFLRSLYTLPFIIFIGIFNPVFDTVPAMTVGSLTVSRGWITFVSIVLRGLMSVQAIMILVEAVGFEGVCRGLRRIGVPAGLVTQLLHDRAADRMSQHASGAHVALLRPDAYVAIDVGAHYRPAFPQNRSEIRAHQPRYARARFQRRDPALRRR